MQNGDGMPYGPGGPFPGVSQPMPYGQASFSGPPSPGNMSAVGSMAKDAEHAQRGGSHRPQSPSVDSVEGSAGRDQSTSETQVQQEPEHWHQHTAGGLFLGIYLPSVLAVHLPQVYGGCRIAVHIDRPYLSVVADTQVCAFMYIYCSAWSHALYIPCSAKIWGDGCDDVRKQCSHSSGGHTGIRVAMICRWEDTYPEI